MSSLGLRYKAPNIWPSLGTYLGGIVIGILAVLVYLNGNDLRNLQLNSLLREMILGNSIAIILAVLAGFSLITSIVFQLIFLYRSWALIKVNARTTPGKAVGFLFIPFFSLYWIFQAYYGWAKDYNMIALQKRIPTVSAGLFLTYTILSLIDSLFSRFDPGIIFSGLLYISCSILLLIMGIQMQNRLRILAAILNAESNIPAIEPVE